MRHPVCNAGAAHGDGFGLHHRLAGQGYGAAVPIRIGASRIDPNPVQNIISNRIRTWLTGVRLKFGGLSWKPIEAIASYVFPLNEQV